jgi:predicted Holliday junction resolvase-like endonuclease
MKNDILRFFAIQRNIFGLCPRSGRLFRLSDCKIFLRTRPKSDWMDEIDVEIERLEAAEERLSRREDALRERARAVGRNLARRVIRKVDHVFAPRHLNPDDAKVLFHPIDFVVFKGMKSSGPMREIIFLDRTTKSPNRQKIQASIAKAIERERYEWLTIRVLEDGSIKEEG